jgi:hypothetical protein
MIPVQFANCESIVNSANVAVVTDFCRLDPVGKWFQEPPKLVKAASMQDRLF